MNIYEVLIIAFMFGIVKADTIWLKRESTKNSQKFGGIFKRLDEHGKDIAILKSKEDTK